MTFYGRENQKGPFPTRPHAFSLWPPDSLSALLSLCIPPPLLAPSSQPHHGCKSGWWWWGDTFLKSRLNQVLGQQTCECMLICASSRVSL